MSDSVSDMSTLFYIVEVALAARTLYGFCRTYFTYKLGVNEPSATTVQQSVSTPTTASSNASSRNRHLVPTVTSSIPQPGRPIAKRPIIVYLDGCFDAMHFGHANAIRQARALGDKLIVGICPDREIHKHKGPNIMNDDERLTAVKSVKWVDQVVPDVPYTVTQDFLNKLITRHGVDIIVHGDDPCLDKNGEDVYKAVKELGRFRTIKRTEGVSSTDLVSRMLSCTRDHHVNVEDVDGTPADVAKRPFQRVSTFLPTTRRLIQFAGDTAAPRPGDRVVYVDGTFDMFHAGHIATLQRARQLGDYLLVGIHDDATVNERKGSNFPIMNVHERTLMVLSCRYVDEVIIGAPWVITEDMIKSMNISCVAHGSYHADGKRIGRGCEPMSDPYVVAREQKLMRQVPSKSDLSVEKILHRIVMNRDAYVERNSRKEASELEYITTSKQYVQEY